MDSFTILGEYADVLGSFAGINSLSTLGSMLMFGELVILVLGLMDM